MTRVRTMSSSLDAPPSVRRSEGEVRRVELCLSLLQMLEIQEQRSWHDVPILDESWFYCTTAHESIWLPPREKPSEKPCVTIQSRNE
jgi:hypothetical protein